MYLATLYKARKVPHKSPPCAICVDRTRGRTQEVAFGYGVKVWLCGGHGSVGFMTQRGGRDLVLTLMQLWKAHGCLTVARHKALDAHLAALAPRPARPRPGSYAWPKLRVHAERLFSTGTPLRDVQRHIRTTSYRNAEPPSRRTVRRWHAQRRWLRPPPRAA